MKPKICIGMFVFNEEKYLESTLDSLLLQTYDDFQIVILNNCSTDRTESIIDEYIQKDKRIHKVNNTRKMGIIENSKIVFELADQDIDYFAWAAGHDIYHPRWLEHMVSTLENNQHAIMAYPYIDRIDENDEKIDIPSINFDTTGLAVVERFRKLYQLERGFGDMIYGFFRASALRKAGVYRLLLTPDVVLIWELSLLGEIAQVKEILWHRRFGKPSHIKERQRSKGFAYPPPFYTKLPIPLVNTLALIWNTSLTPGAGSIKKRCLGLYASWMYLKRSLNTFFKNFSIYINQKASA